MGRWRLLSTLVAINYVVLADTGIVSEWFSLLFMIYASRGGCFILFLQIYLA
jgi:hypothetical protein